MIKILEKSKIPDLLKAVAEMRDVYFPRRFAGGDVLFDRLPDDPQEREQALAEMALGDENLVIPPKDIFFPQLESLFSFTEGAIDKQQSQSKPKLLLGIKPCDLKGLELNYEFFKHKFEDVYYLSKAEHTLCIVIGCLTPPRPKECFCTSAGTGPFASEGFDLQLIENGGRYLAEIGSPRGEEFVKEQAMYFSDSTPYDVQAAREIKAAAADKVQLRVLYKRALEIMKQDDFKAEWIYKKISDKCLHCGACCYVCPTCTCFDVYDNADEHSGSRLRTWDSCVFSGYTREASGHNPRGDLMLRTARRVDHKLKYFHVSTRAAGCVGCGRCLASCPVHIGISHFIQEITERKSAI